MTKAIAFIMYCGHCGRQVTAHFEKCKCGCEAYHFTKSYALAEEIKERLEIPLRRIK